MVKQRNTNSNFNIGTDVRNRQIYEIINADRHYNRRLFDLEKQEYEKVYPDVMGQVTPNELPPQVRYQFGVNASKFYSVLIYFTSQIQDLVPEDDTTQNNINFGLKWSDFFEAYGSFRSQVQSFLKIPQSFQDNTLLLEFDKIISASEEFGNAIEAYKSDYGDEYPLKSSYENQILQMMTFLNDADISLHNKLTYQSSQLNNPSLQNENPDELLPTQNYEDLGMIDDFGDDDDGEDGFGGPSSRSMGPPSYGSTEQKESEGNDEEDQGDQQEPPSGTGYTMNDYKSDKNEIKEIEGVLKKIHNEIIKISKEKEKTSYPHKKVKYDAELKKADQAYKHYLSLQKQAKQNVAIFEKSFTPTAYDGYDEEEEGEYEGEGGYEEEERPAGLEGLMTGAMDPYAKVVGSDDLYGAVYDANDEGVFSGATPMFTPNRQEYIEIRDAQNEQDQHAYEAVAKEGREYSREVVEATEGGKSATLEEKQEKAEENNRDYDKLFTTIQGLFESKLEGINQSFSDSEITQDTLEKEEANLIKQQEDARQTIEYMRQNRITASMQELNRLMTQKREADESEVQPTQHFGDTVAMRHDLSQEKSTAMEPSKSDSIVDREEILRLRLRQKGITRSKIQSLMQQYERNPEKVASENPEISAELGALNAELKNPTRTREALEEESRIVKELNKLGYSDSKILEYLVGLNSDSEKDFVSIIEGSSGLESDMGPVKKIDQENADKAFELFSELLELEMAVDRPKPAQKLRPAQQQSKPQPKKVSGKQFSKQQLDEIAKEVASKYMKSKLSELQKISDDLEKTMHALCWKYRNEHMGDSVIKEFNREYQKNPQKAEADFLKKNPDLKDALPELKQIYTRSSNFIKLSEKVANDAEAHIMSQMQGIIGVEGLKPVRKQRMRSKVRQIAHEVVDELEPEEDMGSLMTSLSEPKAMQSETVSEIRSKLKDLGLTETDIKGYSKPTLFNSYTDTELKRILAKKYDNPDQIYELFGKLAGMDQGTPISPDVRSPVRSVEFDASQLDQRLMRCFNNLKDGATLHSFSALKRDKFKIGGTDNGENWNEAVKRTLKAMKPPATASQQEKEKYKFLVEKVTRANQKKS
jgi:hypothetical protein